MPKYNIVTGFNRGGTSALMLALKQAGIPVVGFKFPLTIIFENPETKKTMKRTDLGTYSSDRKGFSDPNFTRHNPTGYWEVVSICLEKGLQKEHQDIGMNGDLIKVPFNVLTSSDPKLIDKALVIFRDPAKTISSQLISADRKGKNRWIRISSLGMLHNAVSGISYLRNNKIEYHIVFYEDLLECPMVELSNICGFLGRGNPMWGTKGIIKKLDRSKPLKSNSKEFKMIRGFFADLRHHRAIKDYNLQELRERIKKIDKKQIVEFKK